MWEELGGKVVHRDQLIIKENDDDDELIITSNCESLH